MHPAKPQAVLNVSGKEMFVVFKSCHLAGCYQRGYWYRGFNTRQLHPSDPCRLKSVPQSCSALMHPWTFLKGEEVMMCWFWTIYPHAHPQHADLHLCLCPSVSNPTGSWALWSRRTWVHLPTCVRGTQSSSSWMLHRPKTFLLCACTSLRMLVWPTHSWFPVTGQKPFLSLRWEYCSNEAFSSSWLHPFWTEDETWQLLVIRGASVSTYLSLNIHAVNNWKCLYLGLFVSSFILHIKILLIHDLKIHISCRKV